MALQDVGIRLVAENEGGFIRSVNKATGAVEDFGGVAGGVSAGTIALGTALGNIATGALVAVKDAFIGAGKAALGFAQESILLAADLEAAVDGIGAVLGATEDDLQTLNDLIIDLGVNPNLKVSSVEAAEAIEVLAKNGITLEQVMNGAAEGTIFLANATGADFALAADIATDTMAIFGIEAENMITAVNGITGVTTSSKFSVDDFRLALANGGATLQGMGVTFDEFNTLLAGTSSRFASGATAGTALRNLFLRLTPATNTAKDAMQQLGFITEDGTNTFFDVNGELKNTREIIGLLSDGFGSLSTEQRSAFAKTIFGVEAMEALNGVIDLGTEGFDDLTASMAAIDAGDAAATRVDNLRGALDILDGVIEAVKLQIGNAFLPTLKELGLAAASFVEENSAGFINFFEGVADVVSKVGVFVLGFVDNLQQGENLIFSFLGALEGIGVDGEKLNSIREFLQTIESVFDIIRSNESTIGKISDLFDFINTPINEESPSLLERISLALGTFFGAIDGGLSPFTAFIAAMHEFGASGETIQTVVDIVDRAKEIFGTFFNSIKETIAAEIPEIQESLTGFNDVWLSLQELFTAAQPIIEGVMLFIGGVILVNIGIMTGVIMGFINSLGELVAFFAVVLDSVIVFITDTVNQWKAGWELIKAIFTGDTEEISQAFENWWQATLTKWGNFFDNVMDIFRAWGDVVGDFLEGFVTTFIQTIENIVPEMRGTGAKIIQGLLDGLNSSRQAVISFFTNLIEEAITSVWDLLGIQSPSRVFKEIGMLTGEGLAIGLADSAPSVAMGTSAMIAPVEAISPPATPAQQMSMNIDNSRTVNFTSNNAGNPAINDRNDLTFALAGFA